MSRNVFVPGLTDLQRGELETIREADRYRFHQLLSREQLVESPSIDFDGLLAAMRAELDAFPGTVDAIIAHWDFPTSVLTPILCAERGIRSPSLESVLRCENKLWSRLEQVASVPGCVPRFSSFDPFAEDPLAQIDVPFPFWVKPVKSYSSMLGFQIDGADELAAALEEIREEIGRVGEAFDRALARVELPPPLRGTTGTTCIAEELISGIQVAPEGSVFQGELNVHGLLDMHKGATEQSFARLDYPASTVPDDVQSSMVGVCERFLRHIGFDNGCFNAELMWDEAVDRLWLVEVNTRISQSHSDLFAKVDGMSNHEVAIDVALGRRPDMPHREGRFEVATKLMIAHEGGGVVRRVPSETEIAELVDRFPETLVDVRVEPGDRFDEHPTDAEHGLLAVVYLGAGDRDELEARCRACHDALPFDVEPVGRETEPPATPSRL